MLTHGKSFKVFACNSSQLLASKIVALLDASLGKATIGRFSDGEISISVEESVRGIDVYIIQSTNYPVNDNIMEILLLADAFKRASAARITAVIPYFGYARQDRKAKSRDPISAKLVADLISTTGIDRVLTLDLHTPQIQGFFNIPVDNLLGVPLLVPYYREKFQDEIDNIVAVSPDFGSVSRARAFAQKLNIPIAIVDKRRKAPNESEVMNIIGDVKNKRVILIDDMIDTAGTICNAASSILENGGAKEVYACASHGVLSGQAPKRLSESVIKELIILDTIYQTQEKQIPQLKTLTVAGLFAEAIKRIYEDRPLATLFDC